MGSAGGVALGRSSIDARITIGERVLRVLLLIVVVSVGAYMIIVMGIVVRRGIVTMVAVVVVTHILLYIGLVVAEVHGFRVLVVGREMTMTVGRNPGRIAGVVQVVPDRRTLYPYRTYDILRAVDIRIADNLYVEVGSTCLGYEGSYVLVDISGQACLDQVDVAIALYGLQYAQIIYVAVAVQVEVVDHVARRVEQLLKLTYAGRLRKGSCHGLEVEIERQVGRDGVDLYRSGCSRTSGRSRYGTDGGDCLGRTYIDGLRRRGGHDTYREAGYESK